MTEANLTHYLNESEFRLMNDGKKKESGKNSSRTGESKAIGRDQQTDKRSRREGRAGKETAYCPRLSKKAKEVGYRC